MIRGLMLFLIIYSIPTFAGSVQGLLAISPDKSWVSHHSPIPGVELVIVKEKPNKDAKFQDNITLIRDQTATIYKNLDLYVDDAVKKLKLIKSKFISKAKKTSSHVGEYYIIESIQQDKQPIIQAVFYRPGLGFYVLTGSFSTLNKTSLQKEFLKMAEGAYFR